MKTLTILRHAKSSWDSAEVSDHDRELNNRGLRDREIIASAMQEKGIRPDIILCSTAARARKTVASVVKDEGIGVQDIVFSSKLYLADPTAICGEIASVSDQYEHILVCGHNPGLTDFVNAHTDLTIDELPTGGLVSAQFNIESWSEIFVAKGNVVCHLWPKLFI